MSIMAVVLAVAAVVAAGAGWWLGHKQGQELGKASVGAALAASQQRADDLAARNLQQESEIRGLREEKAALETQKARAEAQLEAAQQSLVSERAALTQAKEELTNTFKALAADALKNTNEQFLGLATRQFDAKQQAIDTLLKPVKETLAELNKQTLALEGKREKAYGELGQQLVKLGEDQASLQKAATTLSSALRNTRTTGKWGEIVLRRVVELAGMTEHCDFTEQHTQDDSRPDLIVHLPNGRKIIVDAKTSVTSFLDAAETADESLRQQKMKEHAKNIRAHALGLAKRRYEKDFENSIDLTVCFIPGDIYYFAALQADPDLFEDAADKNIIFATPTTLIALLKAAAFGWQQDLSGSKAKEIVKQAQDIYDRLVTATGHLTGLGKNISKSVESYDALIGSLERSVFPAARDMKKLGMSGSELPPMKPLHETTRQLKAKDWQMQQPAEGLALAAGAEDDPASGV